MTLFRFAFYMKNICYLLLQEHNFPILQGNVHRISMQHSWIKFSQRKKTQYFCTKSTRLFQWHHNPRVVLVGPLFCFMWHLIDVFWNGNHLCLSIRPHKLLEPKERHPIAVRTDVDWPWDALNKKINMRNMNLRVATLDRVTL